MAGVTPGMVVGADHRGHRRRGTHPHGRRHRRAHPFHQPAAGLRGDGERRDDLPRRGHRPRHRHERHHLHARARATSSSCCARSTGCRSTSGSPARATARAPEGLDEQLAAGAVGLKLHEDWGTTPSRHRRLPGVAERHDVQVAIHTDTLNERRASSTPSPRSGGAPSTRSTPRAPAAGTRPTSCACAASRTCCPRSTNPTRPFTVNTLDEHLDMLMVCHHLDPAHPGGRRLRGEPHPR